MEKAKECELKQFRVGRGISNPTLQLDIGGYPISCLNFKKRIVIAVDDECVTFVHNGIMPFAEQSSRSWLLNTGKRDTNSTNSRLEKGVQPSEKSGSQTSYVSTSYTSKENLTPNSRDKVTWHPEIRTWKVLATTKHKDVEYTRGFVVEALKEDEFRQRKIEKYLLAVDEWNQQDKSKRHRIEVPSLVRDMIKKAKPRVGSASGVQPSPASSSSAQSSPESSTSAKKRNASSKVHTDDDDAWMSMLRKCPTDPDESYSDEVQNPDTWG